MRQIGEVLRKKKRNTAPRFTSSAMNLTQADLRRTEIPSPYCFTAGNYCHVALKRPGSPGERIVTLPSIRNATKEE